MKIDSRVVTLFFVLVASFASGSEPAPGSTMVLKNGKVLQDVKVTSETDEAIFVRHRGGMVKVLKADLSGRMARAYPTAFAKVMNAIEERYAVFQPSIDSSPLVRTLRVDHETVRGTWELKYDPAYSAFAFSGQREIGDRSYSTPHLTIPVHEFAELLPLLLKYHEWTEICRAAGSVYVTKSMGVWNGSVASFGVDPDGRAVARVGERTLSEADIDALLALSIQMHGLATETANFVRKSAEVESKLLMSASQQYLLERSSAR